MVSRTLTRARVRASELSDFMTRGWPDTLTRLQLGGEALTSLPTSLGQLSALQTLNLSDCWYLTSLPGSLRQLPALQTLDLSRCWALTSLLAWLGQLSALPPRQTAFSASCPCQRHSLLHDSSPKAACAMR